MEKELVKDIIDRYESDDGMLIPMLQDLQTEYGYLPADQLRKLAKQLQVPLSRIYSVATFYASFRMAPKGAHEVTLCMGTVCYLKGAAKISETICREFKVEPGGTTPDRLFSYQPVNCVGACALAPVMIVDGEYHDGVTPEKAMKILNSLSAEGEAEKAPPKREKQEKAATPAKATAAKGKAVSGKAAIKTTKKTPARSAVASGKTASGTSAAKTAKKTPAKTTAAKGRTGISKGIKSSQGAKSSKKEGSK